MTTATKQRIKAGDIMVSEPVCVERSTTIHELARVFEENGISGAPVVDPEGRLVGIVSKSDLIRHSKQGTLDLPPAFLFEVISEQGGPEEDLAVESSICVEDFMTEDPVTVLAETPAGEVARKMFEGRFHRVVVVDAQRYPIGIITSMDMLGAFPRG